MLPDTGVAQQSTTIFATILAALGLGFLVKRRKPTGK
ncbi:LPXTG cell wall anchor domain-containing protein [Lacicoccus alkaliphilus]